MSGAVLILCTVASENEAARIARTLVEERLAACVQVSPIQSWYRWEAQVEQAAEHRLHIKTAAHRADALTVRLRALHDYAVPEIVVLPILGGSADYLAWIAAETMPDRA